MIKYLGSLNKRLACCGDFIIQWGGSIFVAIMMASIYYGCVYVSAELIYSPDDASLEWLTFIANIIVFEILINLLCFIYYSKYNSVTFWHRQSCVADLRLYAEQNETNELERVTVPSVLDEHLSFAPSDESGSKFCVSCNKEAPQRSHHCPLCKMCVIRKDHHCFVTGACVGLGNQRYFIVFLFWCVVGLILSIPHLWYYMNNVVYYWYPFGFFYYIGPIAILRWFLGYSQFFSTVMATILSFAVASFITALGFFGMQIYYTAEGYTMYEYHNLTVRSTFNGDGENIGERFRLVFGKNWILNFIIPQPWNMPVLTPAISDSLFRVRSKVL